MLAYDLELDSQVLFHILFAVEDNFLSLNGASQCVALYSYFPQDFSSPLPYMIAMLRKHCLDFHLIIDQMTFPQQELANQLTRVLLDVARIV